MEEPRNVRPQQGSAPVRGPIHRLLGDDHARLDGFLRRATASGPDIDMAVYGEFRKGLLRHIGLEEKILLPAAQQSSGGEPLPIAAKLRLDHGALAALMVPTPTPAIVNAIRRILAAHNEIEESTGGVYDSCERLLGTDGASVLARLQAAPEVPVHAHVDGPLVLNATRRALARAGYEDWLEERNA